MGAASRAGEAAMPAMPLLLRRARRPPRAPLPGLRQPRHRQTPHPRAARRLSDSGAPNLRFPIRLHAGACSHSGHGHPHRRHALPLQAAATEEEGGGAGASADRGRARTDGKARASQAGGEGRGGGACAPATTRRDHHRRPNQKRLKRLRPSREWPSITSAAAACSRAG